MSSGAGPGFWGWACPLLMATPLTPYCSFRGSESLLSNSGAKGLAGMECDCPVHSWTWAPPGRAPGQPPSEVNAAAEASASPDETRA